MWRRDDGNLVCARAGGRAGEMTRRDAMFCSAVQCNAMPCHAMPCECECECNANTKSSFAVVVIVGTIHRFICKCIQFPWITLLSYIRSVICPALRRSTHACSRRMPKVYPPTSHARLPPT